MYVVLTISIATLIGIQTEIYQIISIRPCKLNYLFLIPVRANFLSPSGYILCIVVEYLISDNNPRRVYIVAIVFFKESSCYYGTITLL